MFLVLIFVSSSWFVLLWLLARTFNKGIRYAIVFPVPVAEQAIKSLLLLIVKNVFSCIDVGFFKPSLSNPESILLFRLKL